jgi:hypothetical protein
MLAVAEREWVYFGQQTVVYTGNEEQILHVGLWEDEDYARSDRISQYWRAVGKPHLSGFHCREPWSAAFMSWVMQQAGIPEPEFSPASAHWVYLARIIAAADFPGRYFVPRRIREYSPQPGDLICAGKEVPTASALSGQLAARDLSGNSLHCDLVVKRDGSALEAIGGNVRNSVSKSFLQLDAEGHLQPHPRRLWFIVLENRL